MRFSNLSAYSFILLVLSPVVTVSQSTDSLPVKQYPTKRISQPPKVDGRPGDAAWEGLPTISDFSQFVPDHGQPARQKSVVRIAYDNGALYVLAELFDTAADSILAEFSARDNFNVNADYFRIAIDPYGKHQDSYVFGVTAAGVQFDEKYYDYTFDAVWESAVSKDEKGWYVEMRIPYSAFRFPATDEQTWSLQVNRSIRRYRELDMWSTVPPDANNPLVYWGHLTGLKGIDPPLRLSLTPYISAYAESVPLEVNLNGDTGYSKGISYNTGADLKYGVDERFTIDMTLLPDFGQVQSDNKVKNLSYREDTYNENRPFFKEGADLFERNGQFYSRRIGKTPSGFYSVESELDADEELVDNPSVVRLINAARFTGRTGNGLGIGVFNAVTNDMYATAKKPDGSQRKILTEPLTNYNALVLDQDLKNNSEVYLYNTNVMREGSFTDANVTTTGFTLSNKKNTYSFGMSGGISHRTNILQDNGASEDENGYAYRMVISKSGGKLNYGYERLVYDNHFQTMDMGYQTINQISANDFDLSYNIYQPVGFIRSSYNEIEYNLSTKYGTGTIVSNYISANSFTTLLSYLTFFGGFAFTPGDFYDYYEPRVPGRFQKGLRYATANLGFSTDYRKTLAVDHRSYIFSHTEQYKGTGFTTSTTFRLRLSQRSNLKLNIKIDNNPKNVGFAEIDNNGNVIYGIRDLSVQAVQLTGSYSFSKDMILSLNARHYRAFANHREYATLMEDGSLTVNNTYNQNKNFDYNIFNVDLVFSWMFAPGSTLSLVYKNIIENELEEVNAFQSYGENLERIINDPQTNSLSLKLVYYLDYQMIKSSRKS
jgi:hypothetical protein